MRKKYIYLRSLTVMSSLLLSTHSLIAAPAINTVSGGITDGQSITISGNGFGVKTPAAPILWDNFNNGTAGGAISSSPNWEARNNSPLYSSKNPYGGGGLSALNTISYGDPYEQKFGSANFFFSGTDELYYSYMNSHVGPSVGGEIYKNGRINTAGNTYSGDGMNAISDGYIFYRPGSSSVYPDVRRFSTVDIGSSNWQRHQMYAKASTPAGTSNGHIFAQVHTHLNDYPNIVSRASGYSFQYTNILLGTMLDQPASGETHYFYIDDVYVDNTIARVEICSGSTWANRSVCDPQIPTGWSDVSITATVNQGAFANNQTAYLYVVDKDGSVNDIGFQITLNEGDSGTIINPPIDFKNTP